MTRSVLERPLLSFDSRDEDERTWNILTSLDMESDVVQPQQSVSALSTEEHAEGDVRVSAEYVEGIPLAIVQLYADIASRHAVVRQTDPGVWFASVAGLEGAWSEGDSPEKALANLPEVIVGWVAVKRRVGARDIPPMEGLDLNPAA